MAFALACVVAGCGSDKNAGAHAALPRGPHNVVVFLVDTLRADRLGAYGHEGGLTPRLDAFAKEALVFERCIAQSTWTKPATASVLTGLYPHAHGANYERSLLPDAVETLAELLLAHGYRTAAFGSNPHVFGSAMGFDQGFETFQGIPPEAPEPFPRGERIVDAALAWLEQERAAPRGASGDHPFFLYLHLIDPHFPYDPPGYDGAVLEAVEDAAELPPEGRAELAALYDREVAYTDAQFGRVIDALADQGLADRTLVVFLSDHGEEFFEHGDLAHHHAKMFEEVSRVPLLVRTPGLPKQARGLRVGAVVEQVDVFATVVDALGLSAAAAGSGTSLLARALRPAASARQHALIEAEDGSLARGIVARDWKYVKRWTPVESEELYNVRLDPKELENRAADEPEVLRAMRVLLAAEMRSVPPTYALSARNGSDAPVRIAGAVLTRTSPADVVRLVDLEPLAPAPDGAGGPAQGDGPFDQGRREQGGETWLAGSFLLRLAPGDADGFVFRMHPTDPVCRVELTADGSPLDPARVLLGDAGEHPRAMPFELLPEDAERWTSAGLFSAPSGLEVRLWRVLETVGEEAELSPEDESVLRAVGYLGDDDESGG